MKPEFTARGGAIIGSALITWPSVKLLVDSNEIILMPSFKILFSSTDDYVFPRIKVTSIEKFALFPYIAWGVRINHFVPLIPQKIIFLCLRKPEKLMREIHEAGFLVAIN